MHMHRNSAGTEISALLLMVEARPRVVKYSVLYRCCLQVHDCLVQLQFQRTSASAVSFQSTATIGICVMLAQHPGDNGIR